MFVYLSKMLPYLVYPAGLLTLMLLIGLIFCHTAKSKNRMMTVMLVFILFCGNKLPGAYLIRKLELAYPPYDGSEKADAIVILGGGTVTKSYPRQTVEVNGAGDRVIFGVHLFREGAAPGILLGGSYIKWRDGDVESEGKVSSPASEMAELMRMFDVPEEAVTIQDISVNTYEEAVEDARILQDAGVSKIILVSSATHMRRAVALFEKQGLKVIPAPTDYSYSDQEWDNLLHFDLATAYTFVLPSAAHMQTLQNAVKEYLGYFIYHLRGWL